MQSAHRHVIRLHATCVCYLSAPLLSYWAVALPQAPNVPIVTQPHSSGSGLVLLYGPACCRSGKIAL
jgi:hypothetical protein